MIFLDGLAEFFVYNTQLLKLVSIIRENTRLTELCSARTWLGVELEHRLHYWPNVIWIVIWNPLIYTFLHSPKKLIHICSLKRWFQSKHLIDDTSKWPYVGFEAIFLISPDFRWCVIRCACLSAVHTVCCNFRNIHVTKFGPKQKLTFLKIITCVTLISHWALITILCRTKKKDVSRLNVSVHDVQTMHGAQSMHYFN